MASSDRRRQLHQAPLHKVASPPAPLLLMPSSQGLTFSSDDVRMTPGLLMPVAQPSQIQPIVEIDSFLGQGTNPTMSVVGNVTQQFTPAAQDQDLVAVGYADDKFSIPLYENKSSNGELADFELIPERHNFISLTPTVDVESPPVTSFVPTFPVLPAGMPDAPVVRSAESPRTVFGHSRPVQFHWFYCKSVELRMVWQPFSQLDSDCMEAAHQSLTASYVQDIVSVNGGRYDVDIAKRLRWAVYWDEPESYVRRCSWFYRTDADSRIVPYEEDYATRLEETYQSVAISGTWHQKIEYPEGDVIIIHSPAVIMHFSAPATGYLGSRAMGEAGPPRVVKRGIDDFDNIPYDEAIQVDHLVFVVHGIGPGCDLRFRSIVECVDDFRAVSYQMLASHFRESQESGRIGRVEFLPVQWHSALHGDATGIDRKLKAITLPSISKLRDFTNDTLLDVLFYGSPAYAQQIANTIGSEMNRLHELFCTRNPSFCGAVSVAGHSLGSLILFDLLAHQSPAAGSDKLASTVPGAFPVANEFNVCTSSEESEARRADTTSAKANAEKLTITDVLNQLSLSSYLELFEREQIDLDALRICEMNDLKEMGLPLGPRKKIMSFLEEENNAKLTRGSSLQDELFSMKSQQDYFAQTTQSDRHELGPAPNHTGNFIVGTSGTGVPLVNYPQLPFKPCAFFALGSPIAMFLTVRGANSLGENFQLPTCPGFFNIFHPFDPVAYRIEPLVTAGCPLKPVLMPHHKGRKRLHLELKENLTRVGSDLKQKIIESVKSTWRTINDLTQYRRGVGSESTVVDSYNDSVGDVSFQSSELSMSTSMVQSQSDEEFSLGVLNGGRRVDYALQEKPIESFNDYLFALSSHACYWESEDTALMIIKELYSLIGVTSTKSVDMVSTNPTVTTFPGNLNSNEDASPPSSLRVLQNDYRPPADLCIPSVDEQPPRFDIGLENTVNGSLVPTPLQAVLPLNVGPPPKSGFVRK